MLTFRMDETNFADGDRDGIRIATGTGLKVDFDEFADDSDTLGLWHLHDGGCQGEGTGLEDESSGGHDFTNHGAEAVEDGYRFVRADGDYMDAAYPDQPERSQITMEGWVRDVGEFRGDANSWRQQIVVLFLDSGPGDNFVSLRAHLRPDPTSSFLRIIERVGATNWGLTPWSGQEVDDLLMSPDPWHFAIILDAPNTFRLFINGVQRAQDSSGIVAFPSGDQTLRFGKSYPGGTTYKLSAVLDEIRLSDSVRYAAGFTPARLLASGTSTSPTFDAVRLQADWTDLVRTQTIPPGCDTTWQVRAADETDAGGDPQALWQPYSGDPPALPDGRHFQWRATLSASEDHLASPTIESVDALASEAGYNLYHASGPGPESLDYDEPWARVGPNVTEAETDALALETVHWFGIRPADAGGRESPTAQDEVRLETGADGEREPDRPAGALAASAVALPLGAARLRWLYRVGHGGVVPQTFRIFGDGGTGTIDYETPLDEVPWREGQSWYAWTSDPLTPGVEHQLAARAVTAGGVWDEQPAIARVTPDATPPAEVDALEAETTP